MSASKRLVLVAALLAVGCGDGGTLAQSGGNQPGTEGGVRREGGSGGGPDGSGGPVPPGPPGGGCIDGDGDGFGAGCERGIDCDDGDPARTAGCMGTLWGEGGTTFDPSNADQEHDGVIVDDEGRLTLGRDLDDSNFVWVANSREGTVSKLDARTGHEIGRYPSAVEHPSNGARPWNERCNMETEGNCPSRTALDFRRDAWVANRAFGNQGTATKIANHLEDCVDLNGDGSIQTSRDANGDGRISLDDPAEFVGATDECVLFTVDVGERNDLPRALAIAPDPIRLGYGSAWIGLNRSRQAVELNGQDGSVLRTVDLDINPYGALADKRLGVVWFTNAGWQIAPDNPPAVQNVNFSSGATSRRYDVDQPIPGCGQDVGTYGITIDELGRIWVAGYPCEGAHRLEPSTATWVSVPTPGAGGPRGLVADGDGHIYMAHSHCDGSGDCATVTRFNIEAPFDVERFELRPEGASGSIGVDLDLDGKVWIINQSSSTATRLDPVTGALDHFPVGEGPYTYSDFTGFGLLTQFPRGYFRATTEACDGALWEQVTFDADVPIGSQVELSVRTAATREALNTTDWIGTWAESPARLQMPPGPVPSGRWFELQLQLSSDDIGVVPTVSHVGVSYQCPIM